MNPSGGYVGAYSTYGFDSQLGYWVFKFTESFQQHYGPQTASNRNEYQEHKARPARKTEDLTAICKPII